MRAPATGRQSTESTVPGGRGRCRSSLVVAAPRAQTGRRRRRASAHSAEPPRRATLPKQRPQRRDQARGNDDPAHARGLSDRHARANPVAATPATAGAPDRISRPYAGSAGAVAHCARRGARRLDRCPEQCPDCAAVCCLLLIASGLGPRIALAVWWLFGDKPDVAIDSWAWGLLGFLVLPWTTLMHIIAWAPSSASTAPRTVR